MRHYADETMKKKSKKFVWKNKQRLNLSRKKNPGYWHLQYKTSASTLYWDLQYKTQASKLYWHLQYKTSAIVHSKLSYLANTVVVVYINAMKTT